MLCLFKTPLDPHPEIPNKLVARSDAGECQGVCHSQVAICEHDPTVQHRKEGSYILAMQQQRFLDGKPLTTDQEAALIRNPDLSEFYTIETLDVVVGSALDLNRREVMISPSCVKSDGTPITMADFPDNWTFGNGVSVAVTVPIQGSDPCILSWCSFPVAAERAVRANYAVLQAIMEA